MLASWPREIKYCCSLLEGRFVLMGEDDYRNVVKPILCGQMQRCVALVHEVGILQVAWVVLQYSLDERQIGLRNGSAQSG